jgi:hypothetical protein
MSFSGSPSLRPELNRPPPRIRHVLYEYDGPKLVLAVDEHERQVIGVAVDEIFEECVTRWVFAPAAPAEVVALLEGGRGLRELFIKGTVRIFDLGPKETSLLWALDGASLADELLPDADATLPELTPAARDQLLSEQRRLANEQPRLARAELLFDGWPVVGRQGINASFAAAAVTGYQELVSMAYGSRRKGGLGAAGPIPYRGESTLYLVGMPRGSVGFALQEIVEQGQTAPSGLAEVVSDVGALIDAAASGDQELAETVGDFEPRVVSTLKEFISVIYKAEATFRLVANDRTYRFDAERVRMAAERTATELTEEPDLAFPGTLLGYLPSGRQFEFREEYRGAILRGRIARNADLDGIRKWLDKRGVAHMRVVTVKRGAGQSHAFTLLGIEPPSERA